MVPDATSLSGTALPLSVVVPVARPPPVQTEPFPPYPMHDISHILFQAAGADQSPATTSTFVGPVAVASAKNNNVVVHGRGLIATRDIKPGECLFVAPPTVSANINEVKRLWSGCNGKKSIEEIAEASLLKSMKRFVKANDKTVAASFMALTSAHSDDEDTPDLQQYDGPEIDVLLGKCEGITDLTATDTKRANDKEVLLGIIRHNAFGPDYHNYDRIEETWTACPSPDAAPYRRILGMYPLAAIINHSCSSNAIRVFAGEAMAVHANASISKGEEIGWSYIPATQPYHARQEQISGKFGFQCKCKRCILDGEALDEAGPDISDGLKALDSLNVSNLCGELIPSPPEFEEQLQSLETLLASPALSNEAKRSLRLGQTNFFINYFNSALQPSNSPDRNRILSLAMNLHFSFLSFHNASTEHLSILHLCYELAAAISSIGTQDAQEKARATKKIAFWTDQLKIAHQIRFGALGNDIASVREAMKHTRVVLRNRNGMQGARWGFI